MHCRFWCTNITANRSHLWEKNMHCFHMIIKAWKTRDLFVFSRSSPVTGMCCGFTINCCYHKDTKNWDISEVHNTMHFSVVTVLSTTTVKSGTLCEHTIYIRLYAHLIPTSQWLGCQTDTSCNFPHQSIFCNTGTGFIPHTLTFLKHFKFGRAAATTSPAPKAGEGN